MLPAVAFAGPSRPLSPTIPSPGGLLPWSQLARTPNFSPFCCCQPFLHSPSLGLPCSGALWLQVPFCNHALCSCLPSCDSISPLHPCPTLLYALGLHACWQGSTVPSAMMGAASVINAHPCLCASKSAVSAFLMWVFMAMCASTRQSVSSQNICTLPTLPLVHAVFIAWLQGFTATVFSGALLGGSAFTWQFTCEDFRQKWKMGQG